MLQRKGKKPFRSRRHERRTGLSAGSVTAKANPKRGLRGSALRRRARNRSMKGTKRIFHMYWRLIMNKSENRKATVGISICLFGGCRPSYRFCSKNLQRFILSASVYQCKTREKTRTQRHSGGDSEKDRFPASPFATYKLYLINRGLGPS